MRATDLCVLPGVSIPGVVGRGEGDHHEEGDDAAVGFHNRTSVQDKIYWWQA